MSGTSSGDGGKSLLDKTMASPLLEKAKMQRTEPKDSIRSVVVHYLCNEIRPAIMFFLGFQTVLAGTANMIVTGRTTLGGVAEDAKSGVFDGVKTDTSVSEYIGCVQGDIASAESSLLFTFTGHCSQIDHNFWGYLAISMKVLTFAFVGVQVYFLVKFCKQCQREKAHISFESGRYIRFTYMMQRAKKYQMAAAVLSAYAAVAGLLTVTIGLTSTSPVAFLGGQLVPLLFMVQGALGFRTTHEPSFMHNVKAFNSLTFNRGKLDMVNQSNADLCKDLEQALYCASMGDPERLDQLVDTTQLPQPTIDKAAEGLFSGVFYTVQEPTEDELREKKYKKLLDSLHPKKKKGLSDHLTDVSGLIGSATGVTAEESAPDPENPDEKF